MQHATRDDVTGLVEEAERLIGRAVDVAEGPEMRARTTAGHREDDDQSALVQLRHYGAFFRTERLLVVDIDGVSPDVRKLDVRGREVHP